MLIGLDLCQTDHCVMVLINFFFKSQKNRKKNIFLEKFLYHQGLYGISIPGDHVTMRDCMDFQCMVVLNFAKKNISPI